MIRRSLVASIVSAASFLAACGDSGTTAGGSDPGGGDPGGNNTGAGNTGGENVGAGTSDGGGGAAPDLCGNRNVDAGEDCDGTDLSGQACSDVGFDGGTLACAADCNFDTADCTTAACGDGEINGNEDCDGALLGGATCVSEGFDAGVLACTANTCSFDTDGCTNISCGDGIINGTDECDGAQLGVGTCITEGFDGGPPLTCSAANCQYVSTACANENCVDGVDNDSDAMIDCVDANCAPECADACNNVPTIADPGTATGTTTGHADAFTNSCGTAEGGTSGPEVVYQSTAAIAGFMHVTLTSAIADHGISAWTGCPTAGTEIPGACMDLDFGADGIEQISLPVTAGQVVHLLVDGFANADAGAFTLDVVTVATATCGDGFIDGVEVCDTLNDPACNVTCTAACGDAVCGGGETSCTCAADCPDDVNTCSGCDCVFAGANPCQCDDSCIQFGDCCANETASCGVDSTTFSFFSAAAPVAITDNGYTGTLASMQCMPVPTNAEGTITSINSVTLAAAHTWVGDLTVKLVSPGGTVITLMSVPGFAEPADDGISSGDSSNLLVANPITFNATAVVSAEAMGAPAAANICAPAPGGDAICSYAPNNGAAAAGNFGTFVGLPVGNGGISTPANWQLCIGDSTATDTGTINSVSINVTIGG